MAIFIADSCDSEGGGGGGGGSVNSVSAGTNVTVTGTVTDPIVNAQNIYTNDGTLSSNRTVTFNTFTLTFDMNSTGRLNLGAHQFRGDNNIVELGRLDANVNLGATVGIDFCSTVGDFNARILRDGGVDGWWSFTQTGLGEIVFNSGGLAAFLIHPNQGIQFYNYGTGVYTGTAAKYLAVDSVGEVIEVDPPTTAEVYTGSVTGSATAFIPMSPTFDNDSAYTLLIQAIGVCTGGGTGVVGEVITYYSSFGLKVSSVGDITPLNTSGSNFGQHISVNGELSVINADYILYTPSANNIEIQMNGPVGVDLDWTFQVTRMKVSI